MKVLFPLIFITMANFAFAEDMRYYDVEIVVIENLKLKSTTSENWPVDITLTFPEKIVQLGDPVLSEWLPAGTDPAASYAVLKANEYKLTTHVEKISETKNQRVVFHTAWRQPGLDKDLALPIYFKHEIPTVPILENQSNSVVIPDAVNVAPKTTPSMLEGVLRVTLARYLHFEAEMTLRDKVSETETTIAPVSFFESDKSAQKQQVIYFNQERRRMRSSELHYLDHPVISMLIQITPYEKKEEPVILKKANVQTTTIKR